MTEKRKLLRYSIMIKSSQSRSAKRKFRIVRKNSRGYMRLDAFEHLQNELRACWKLGQWNRCERFHENSISKTANSKKVWNRIDGLQEKRRISDCPRYQKVPQDIPSVVKRDGNDLVRSMETTDAKPMGLFEKNEKDSEGFRKFSLDDLNSLLSSFCKNIQDINFLSSRSLSTTITKQQHCVQFAREDSKISIVLNEKRLQSRKVKAKRSRRKRRVSIMEKNKQRDVSIQCSLVRNDLESKQNLNHCKRFENDKLECFICMEKEACVASIQCGHMIGCLSCAKGMHHCPRCRKKIVSKLRVYV